MKTIAAGLAVCQANGRSVGGETVAAILAAAMSARASVRVVAVIVQMLVLIGPSVLRDQVRVAAASTDRNPAGERGGGQSLRRCRNMFGSGSPQLR